MSSELWVEIDYDKPQFRNDFPGYHIRCITHRNTTDTWCQVSSRNGEGHTNITSAYKQTPP